MIVGSYSLPTLKTRGSAALLSKGLSTKPSNRPTAAAFGQALKGDIRQTMEPKIHQMSRVGRNEDDLELEELSGKIAKLAVDVSVLLSALQRIGAEACQVTASNLRIHRDIASQVLAVAQASVVSAEGIVERTLEASLELQGIDKVEDTVSQLETAVAKYENMARAIINRS